MGSRQARRYFCRCGTRLAKDNTGGQCASCERASRDKLIAPPRVPAEFWQTEQFQAAFAAQHIGRVARAYRVHPHHHAAYGPSGISQTLLGQWLGLRQPQVSQIETGPPIRNLDTLVYWARTLHIPAGLLWFRLPGEEGRLVVAGTVGGGLASDAHKTVPPTYQPDGGLVLPTDSAVPAIAAGLPLPNDVATLLVQCLGSLAPSDRDVLATPHDPGDAFDQLVQFLTGWTHTMKHMKHRRDVLRTLRTLGQVAAIASLFQAIDPEEQERVASVLSRPSRVDAVTIEHIEAILWRCQRQEDALGPQAVLDTVLAQRNLAQMLLRDCPDPLRPRMLSVLSSASRHAGWLSFDLNEFDSAWYFYEDARALAHEAGNIELGAFVLCNMSQLATWQRKPRIGIDHAVAAGEWTKRTDDVPVQAYAANVAARAYAADGQSASCMAALDTAGTALAMTGDRQPSYVYFYDQYLHNQIRGLCHLELHEPQRAAGYFEQLLKNNDPWPRRVGLVAVGLGTVRMQSKEIDEAARLLGVAGEIAARNSSARLAKQLQQARAGMQPWQNTSAVRTLDDRLVSYGLA